MKDDYLWDRSGEIDAEVERLERLLAPYRHERPLQAVVPLRPPVRPRPLPRWLAACAALVVFAVAAVALATWYRLHWSPERPWSVVAVEGIVTIEGAAVTPGAAFGEGDVLQTGAGSSARIRVARIGELTVRPSSVVQLQSTSGRRHRVSLQQGTVSARVWAPPFVFSVQTPLGLAHDLGCEFDLHAAGETGHIAVTSGWVDFDGRSRSSLIPEGAVADLYAAGPGTPRYRDAPAALVEAVRRYDGSDAAALDDLLAAARPRDVMTLLHILERAPAAERPAIFARTAMLAPPPAGVTLARVMNNRSTHAVDEWRHSAGLRGIKRWWINWRDALPR